VKKWKIIFLFLLVTFVALQFFNPPHKKNPPVKNDFLAANLPPPRIEKMLRAACYDCHSSETRWPWYSHVAPISWQIVQDVDDGRAQLNLSDWPVENPRRAAKKLEDMSEQIDYDEMPLKKYTFIHADARLTAAQKKDLTDWLDAQAAHLKTLP
jgi:hypothetical protein